MIDDLTILFSTLMTIFVIFRAATLNRTRPWFETRALDEQAQAGTNDTKPRTGRPVPAPAPAPKYVR